jgi:DNA-binding sugar fermentation-stimulating protein
MPFNANGLEICEYEALRLERIARNKVHLESLGRGEEEAHCNNHGADQEECYSPGSAIATQA